MNGMPMGYDYRSPPQPTPPYKPNPPMEHMQQMHPSMYYDPQGPPPMEAYMPPPMPVDTGYDQRYYWREMDSKPQEVYPPQQYQPPPLPNLLQRISGLIKSQLPYLQSISMQVSSAAFPR